MMKLIARGEELARRAQERQVQTIADRLRTMFGDGVVNVEQGQILVRGRSVMKRWLIDPGLRFLAGAPK